MTRFDGADLSHHQDDAGPIDWPTLRAASIGGWVATKATQSTTYVDPTCNAHRAQMATQGFRHRGLYHWISPNTDPVAQAVHYITTVATLHPGEFAMLDAEEGGITAAMCLDWLRVVEQATHRPASVYTGAYVAGGTIWQSTEIRHSDYGYRPMHLAAYTSEAKAKALPGVAAYPWSAWQFSSNGPVPGVTGRCDMNRVDFAGHYDLAAGIEAPEPVPEDEMPKFYDNAEPRTMPYGQAQPRTAVFIADLFKRNIGAEEYASYGNPPRISLSNAALDAIPDAVADGDGTDPATIARIAKLETVTLQLNDAVGRTGQTVGDIQMNLIKAGGGA